MRRWEEAPAGDRTRRRRRASSRCATRTRPTCSRVSTPGRRQRSSSSTTRRSSPTPTRGMTSRGTARAPRRGCEHATARARATETTACGCAPTWRRRPVETWTCVPRTRLKLHYPSPRGRAMDETSPAATLLQGTAWSPPAATGAAPVPIPTASQPALPSTPPSLSGSDLADPLDVRASALYLNRELSWLEFNARVLAEAESETVPPLERLKFLAIVSSNLDEFFMVRVAGLKQQRTGEVGEMGPDGMTVVEQLDAIAARVHQLVATQSHSLAVLLPKLAEAGIVFVKPGDLSAEALADLDARFRNEVFPILTPIAIDPGHPFPQVRNRSLNLGVMFTREGTLEPGFGVVQVPSMLTRLLTVTGVKTPGGQPATRALVLLEDLIARHVSTIFPGVRIKGMYVFRVTRNFDIEIDEEEADDLLQSIQQELRRRERGNAVRLEVSGHPPAAS